MNKIYLCLILFAVIACKKENNLPEDHRCSNLIVENPIPQLLSNEIMDTINYLFNKNQMSTDGLQFFYYKHYFGDITFGTFTDIGAYTFVNGLKVFEFKRYFGFYENELSANVGYYSPLNLTLPENPNLTLPQVRAIFIESIQRDSLYKNNTKIQDSCMNIEYGYYKKLPGLRDINKNYTIGWKVYPNNKAFPYAYIDDVNKKLGYYNNGAGQK